MSSGTELIMERMKYVSFRGRRFLRGAVLTLRQAVPLGVEVLPLSTQLPGAIVHRLRDGIRIVGDRRHPTEYRAQIRFKDAV